MLQPAGVSQLVHSLFDRPREKQRLVVTRTIEPLAQSRQGDHRALPAPVGQAKHKIQPGLVKVEVNHTQHPVRLPGE